MQFELNSEYFLSKMSSQMQLHHFPSQQTLDQTIKMESEFLSQKEKGFIFTVLFLMNLQFNLELPDLASKNLTRLVICKC